MKEEHLWCSPVLNREGMRMQRKPQESGPNTIVMYEDSQSKQNPKRNFICFGSPRCGTSMVAGAMVGLGIDMGDNLPVNIEDPAFNPDGKRHDRPAFIDGARARIQKQAEKGVIWGWKCPQAVEYLQDIRDELVSPRLIIVYRDPVPAVIRAVAGKTAQTEIDKVGVSELDKIFTLYTQNLALAKSWKVPTMLVSYERASKFPGKFLHELAGFVGLPVPINPTPILDFMKPGNYKVPPYPENYGIAPSENNSGFLRAEDG